MEYTFRKALDTELDRIMEIIEEAKRQMHRDGKVQWDKTYPAREHIEADIKEGTAYVMTHEGRIIAYGAVVFTGEPAYNKIHGKWLSEQPYVVLHRLAVTEDAKGHGVGAMFLQEVERLCRTSKWTRTMTMNACCGSWTSSGSPYAAISSTSKALEWPSRS